MRAALDSEKLSDAERLRVVYLLITSPERDGGAGVTPGLDGWNYVDSIFPLHDSKFNRVYHIVPKADGRNGFNRGLANGLSQTLNWILFAIISARNSLFISLIRNIISSLLFHSQSLDLFPTIFFLLSIRCMQFVS